MPPPSDRCPSSTRARRLRSLATALAVGAATAFAGGCATFIDPVPPQADPSGRYAALTRPIVALGDTQEHESTGFPLHDNDGAVDAYVEVAQRPPEQPLFGRRILEWALLADPNTPVIHLGDLLDMSCESEMDRMRQVFSTARQPKALLPGNHDGFFMGIFNFDVLAGMADGESAKWERACRRGTREGGAGIEPASGAALTKRGFIVAYLANVAGGPHTRVTGLAVPDQGDTSISWRNPDAEGFIGGIEARVRDRRLFGHSFIAQQLRLPAAPGASRRVVMIGLDTNQVDVVVGILDTLRGVSPGDIGHVRQDQLQAIRPWIEDARRAGDIVVFAGHHNWNRLSFSSQRRLAELMATLDHPLVYVSAHTHRGFWAAHRLGDRALLELNVSSLSDWPIAYRRVTFAMDESANRLKVVAELMPNLGEPPADDRAILDAWETLTCGRSGIAAGILESQERMVVMQQREARGTLTDWLYQGLGEWCRPCMQSLYESGLRYQDAMLTAIDQFYLDLRLEVPEVRAMGTPALCEGEAVPVCIARLRRAQGDDLDRTIALFTRRASFIEDMSRRMDGLTDTRVRNYMACRAVVAARVDYDLTPDDRRSGRGEANRKRQDFFRIEATVGMR